MNGPRIERLGTDIERADDDDRESPTGDDPI
jgi:hypothetical protein